jgi:hypothetical protein
MGTSMKELGVEQPGDIARSEERQVTRRAELRERAAQVCGQCRISAGRSSEDIILLALERIDRETTEAERERVARQCAGIAARHAALMDECVTVLREQGNPGTHSKAGRDSARHIEYEIRRLFALRPDPAIQSPSTQEVLKDGAQGGQ